MKFFDLFKNRTAQKDDNIIDITAEVKPIFSKPKIEHLGEIDLTLKNQNSDTPIEEVGNVYRKYNPDTNESIEIFCVYYPYRINYSLEIYDQCKKLEMISVVKSG